MFRCYKEVSTTSVCLSEFWPKPVKCRNFASQIWSCHCTKYEEIPNGKLPFFVQCVKNVHFQLISTGERDLCTNKCYKGKFGLCIQVLDFAFSHFFLSRYLLIESLLLVNNLNTENRLSKCTGHRSLTCLSYFKHSTKCF